MGITRHHTFGHDSCCLIMCTCARGLRNGGVAQVAAYCLGTNRYASSRTQRLWVHWTRCHDAHRNAAVYACTERRFSKSKTSKPAGPGRFSWLHGSTFCPSQRQPSIIDTGRSCNPAQLRSTAAGDTGSSKRLPAERSSLSQHSFDPPEVGFTSTAAHAGQHPERAQLPLSPPAWFDVSHQ